MKLRNALAAIALLAFMYFPASAAESSGYHLMKTVRIGGDGSWDYITADAESHRLYISHATKVEIWDTTSYQKLGEIPDTQGVHGIALAPQLGRGFTSNGHENAVTIFDLKTLSTIQKVKVTGENPDAIVFDPASGRVFTFNGRSKNATAIDATSGKVAGTIPLDGKPEFAVADGGGKVFVNIENKSELTALDSKQLKVLSTHSLAPCDEPSGLAMDREHRRLFSGCDNKLMTVTDADSGKVITTLPIGEGVDANAFDPVAQFAFSSNGADGTLTVVHEDSPSKFHVVENIKTAKGARTMARDGETHQVFLVTASFGQRPAPSADNPHTRPTIVPGSFELLVFGR